jgi:hypothetical protein
MSMNLTLDGLDLYQTPTQVTWFCLWGTREHPLKKSPVNHIQARLRYVAWVLGNSGCQNELANEHITEVMSVKNPRFSYI